MVAAWLIGVGLSAIRATAARNPLEGLYLIARLLAEIGVPKVDVPVKARVRVVLILAYSFATSEGIAGWRYSVLVHSL